MPLSLLFLLPPFRGRFRAEAKLEDSGSPVGAGGWFGWWNPVWQQMVIPHPTKEAPLPTPPEQNKIAEVLLRNIYRSFDYLQDADVYSALSRSADGDYLEKLYLQIKKGLILTEQGGSAFPSPECPMARIRTNLAPNAGTELFSQREMEITGTVEHWGATFIPAETPIVQNWRSRPWTTSGNWSIWKCWMKTR